MHICVESKPWRCERNGPAQPLMCPRGLSSDLGFPRRGLRHRHPAVPLLLCHGAALSTVQGHHAEPYAGSAPQLAMRIASARVGVVGAVEAGVKRRTQLTTLIPRVLRHRQAAERAHVRREADAIVSLTRTRTPPRPLTRLGAALSRTTPRSTPSSVHRRQTRQSTAREANPNWLSDLFALDLLAEALLDASSSGAAGDGRHGRRDRVSNG